MDLTVIIPPNTTATIHVPGTEAQPVEVQSGTHHWSYIYTDPDVHLALSIDSTIRDLHDDPVSWGAVTRKLTQLIPQNVFVVNMLKSQSARSLRQALAGLPNADEVVGGIAEALAQLEQRGLRDA